MKGQKVCLSKPLASSIGIVYIWFGMLKYFPGLSPADELAIDTIELLTFGYIPSKVSIILLATWETLVGVMLIINFYRKYAIIFALIHMICTFTPLIIFPNLSFNDFPFGFSLVGQYIFKNIIIICALIVLLRLVTEKERQFC